MEYYNILAVLNWNAFDLCVWERSFTDLNPVLKFDREYNSSKYQYLLLTTECDFIQCLINPMSTEMLCQQMTRKSV